MGQKDIKMWNYINDMFLARSNIDAKEAFDTLVQLVKELGVPLNQDKVTDPSKKMIIMGIEIDVQNFTLAILKNKWLKSRRIFKHFRTNTTVQKETSRVYWGSYFTYVK